MRMVFIGDGHLKGGADPNQADLVSFLDSLKADTLAVMGDLFDFWTGSNDVAKAHYRPVLDALTRLKGRGTRIMYFEGNHDFSMGPFFTVELKAKVFEGNTRMELGGKRFLLGHGDTVGMSAGYMLWRAYLRSPVFRVMSRIATPSGVWAIANRLSKKSRKRSYVSKENFVEKKLREFAVSEVGKGADFVVLGHSHEPGVSQIESGGRLGVYANPGSWARDRSYLVFDGKTFKVEKWSKPDGRAH
jgi:UDP-2,3-diacylglucosamine hydrolase